MGPDTASDQLGHIKAVVFTRDGQLAILDDKMSRLRVFDSSGNPRQSLGREGRGPGEFFNPVSLAEGPDGRLYVGDLARTLQVFVRGTAGYRYDRTIRLEVAARRLCVFDSVIVVHGVALGKDPVVHVYSRDGRLLRSFGALYRSPNRVLNFELNLGRLSCDAARQIVFYAPDNAIGELRAFRVTGEPLWRIQLTGYRVNRIEDYQGGIRVSGDQGVHSMYSLTPIPGFGLLCQVAFRTEQALRERIAYSTLTSFLLDEATGQPRAIGTSLPPIFAARGTLAATGEDEPEPHFTIRELARH